MEKTAAIGCGDGYIRILDVESMELSSQFKAHEMSVNALCFHPERNVLLSGGKDAHLKMWDSDSFKLIESIPAHNYAIYSISFSPDNNLFATGSRDKTIKIWGSSDFNFLSRIDKDNNEGHLYSVNKTFWMKNALLSASDDKKIIGWSIEEN